MMHTGVCNKLLFRSSLVLAVFLGTSLACNLPIGSASQQLAQATAQQQTLVAELVAKHNPSQPAPMDATQSAAQSNTETSPSIVPEITPAPPTVTIPGPDSNQPTRSPENTAGRYITQPGDTLTAIARRFKVAVSQISSDSVLPREGFILAGTALIIPGAGEPNPSSPVILPDNEVINSPTALDFDIETFIASQEGFLNSYSEDVYDFRLTGAQIIERVAQESSVNPRLLLAFLEYRAGWVAGALRDPADLDYPLGFQVPDRRGLYQELAMAATHLNIGYYGWRTGELTSLKYSNGSTSSIDPWLNPGSVAVQNLFAKFYKPQAWRDGLYGDYNFLSFYQAFLGDPWQRAVKFSSGLAPGLSQPELELPFGPGERWSLTGGPHPSWNTGSPRGALDFAPVTGEPACTTSRAWVTASSNGVIVRSENNVVALDLDGDGNEQTGWVIIYLHIADLDRVPLGQQVQVNDRIGHPSCERGKSTGTHVHIARKYNGEWLEASNSVPFLLSGWQVFSGERNYQGTMVKGSKVITASPVGPSTSIITR
ncbi:MAG: LysM peptidoglycan-binding domain-containing M23 family metallopeptidase [Anaerolineales bacterium]|nr:LysM peptidoglycan-binding domain-containing M23 family metallopeptidase [Anaerolineales bacterium]